MLPHATNELPQLQSLSFVAAAKRASQDSERASEAAQLFLGVTLLGALERPAHFLDSLYLEQLLGQPPPQKKTPGGKPGAQVASLQKISE